MLARSPPPPRAHARRTSPIKGEDEVRHCSSLPLMGRVGAKRSGGVRIVELNGSEGRPLTPSAPR